MTIITIRTDDRIKKLLQEKAKQLGLSLNQFINLGFRYILKTNKLVIDLQEDDITWNKEIEKEYEDAVKQLKRWEALVIDPKTIKSEKEFLDVLRNSNV